MPETWVGFLGLENPRPWGGNGNSLQYSCLENPLDSGAWQALVHGVAKSWTRLSNWAHTHSPCSRHDAFGLKSKITSAIMVWKHKVLFGSFFNQGRRVCFSESFLPHSLQDLTSSGISFQSISSAVKSSLSRAFGFKALFLFKRLKIPEFWMIFFV